MRFGAVLPTQEVGSDPIAVRDYVQAVEGLGFDHLVTYDHVLGAVQESREPPLTGPYDEKDPFHEPLVLFGFLAALTSTLEFCTGVLVLPQRQTALVAKQVAEVSLLSGGRIRLAVGTGWNHTEYESLGQDFDTRGPRLTEQMKLLRRLWTEPVIDFEGRFHRVDRAGILPLPEVPIPLWCGGKALPALKRAARHGDGFMWGSTRPEVFEQAPVVLDLVAGYGRDPATFGLEAVVDVTAGEKEWERRLTAFEIVGGTHFSFRTISTAADWMQIRDPACTSVSQHIDALERFAKTCM
ncbi:LLM class F420-dependent oxidoreductase [Rhodococcus aetherivorans]|uniref:LLM class F420-dependent oxidoreductase n=1 Tax=Rhodococcus aetherivorans TaxID=191292 RepID=UPI003649975D